jgi:hypothetical protein
MELLSAKDSDQKHAGMTATGMFAFSMFHF